MLRSRHHDALHRFSIRPFAIRLFAACGALAVVASACGQSTDTVDPVDALDPVGLVDADDPVDADEERTTVSATTGIWADITSNVACGDNFVVEVVIPDGADPHGFEPSLADRARMDSAAVVIANGLGLEEGLLDTLDAVESDGTPVLRVGDLLDPIAYGSSAHGGEVASDEHDEHEDDHDGHDDDHDEHADEDGHDGHADEHDDDHGKDEHADEDDHDEHDEHADEDDHDEHADEDDHDEHADEDDHDEHADEDDHDDDHADEDEHDDHEGHGHEAGSSDPHVWFDPQRMIDAVDHIADALVEHAGADRQVLDACVSEYVAELEQLDAAVQDRVASLDPAQRLLVTNHDALGYFATRYGFELVGTVLPTSSGLAAANPRDLEQLAFIVEELKVPAIFAETQRSSSDAEAVAERVGDVAVVTLRTGSLGQAGTGADTYVGLVRSTADAVVDALS